MEPEDKKRLLRGVGLMTLGVAVIWFSMRLGGKKPDDAVPIVGTSDEMCAQVITPARDPQTGETVEFPTPCDVPEGWELVDSAVLTGGE